MYWIAIGVGPLVDFLGGTVRVDRSEPVRHIKVERDRLWLERGPPDPAKWRRWTDLT
jgi:hypothetical protein